MNNFLTLVACVPPASFPREHNRGPLLSPILSRALSCGPFPSLQTMPASGSATDVVYASHLELDIASYDGLSGNSPPTEAFGLGTAGSYYSTGEIAFPYVNIPPPPLMPSSGIHVYRPLAPCTQQTADYWMTPCTVQRKTLFGCNFPTCTVDLLMTKTKARKHVHGHLGITKLYECSCGVQFACLDSAKRHANTQDKTYPCQLCLTHFARKDYRGAHQRKCSGPRTSA